MEASHCPQIGDAPYSALAGFDLFFEVTHKWGHDTMRRATANLSPADSKVRAKCRFRLRPAVGLNEIRYRLETNAKSQPQPFFMF